MVGAKEPATDSKFHDTEFHATLDPFEQMNLPGEKYAREMRHFVESLPSMDYYMVLHAHDVDFLDGMADTALDERAASLTKFIKNLGTDFRLSKIAGSEGSEEYEAGVGIIPASDPKFREALAHIDNARQVLAFPDSRTMYDREQGKAMVDRLTKEGYDLCETQILGISPSAIPATLQDGLVYLAKVSTLRKHQIKLYQDSLSETAYYEKGQIVTALGKIDAAHATLERDVEEAAQKGMSYEQLFDLLDMRGPVWEKVGETLGIGMDQLRQIGRGTRRLLWTIARRSPVPLAAFFVSEFIAPKVYSLLPDDVKAVLVKHAETARSKTETILDKGVEKLRIGAKWAGERFGDAREKVSDIVEDHLKARRAAA